MRKRLMAMFLMLFVLAFTSSAYAAPKVTLNGQNLSFDVSPIVENGSTLVPLRAIFEALGANISWDEATQTITATKDVTEIKLIIGGQAYKNGQPVDLAVPAMLINNRTMVPLRFISESFGCQVSWDDTTETVSIMNTSDNQVPGIVWEAPVPSTSSQQLSQDEQLAATSGKYVGSKESHKFHYPTCRWAKKIKPENKVWFQTKDEAQSAGYEPCGVCNP